MMKKKPFRQPLSYISNCVKSPTFELDTKKCLRKDTANVHDFRFVII